MLRDGNDIIHEPQVEHVWEKGTWRIQSWEYSTREDKCTLCGCERLIANSWSHEEKKRVSYPSSYSRGEMIFDRDPGCWGAKNPI